MKVRLWLVLCVFPFAPLAGRLGGAEVEPPASSDRWQKIESPYFVMFSAANEAETLDWAVELHLYFSLLTRLIGNDANGRSSLTILMFKDDGALAPFRPQVDGRPAPSAAYFTRDKLVSTVALLPRDNASGTRRLLYHDGLHWLMGRFTRTIPVWFEEGLAEFYSSLVLSGDRVLLGSPIPSHLALLRKNALLSTDEMLGVTTESFLFNESGRNSRLYAQAWLALHSLILDAKDNRAAGVARYFKDTQRGWASGEMFQQAFGLSSSEMDARLANYLKQERVSVSGIRFDRTEVEKNLRRSPADSWEVDLAFGIFTYHGKHWEESERRLQSVVRRRGEDPRAHYWLSQLAIARNNLAGALAHLDRAIANGETHYSAFYGRAYATLLSLRPKGELTGLDQKTLRTIVDDLSVAMRHSPWEKSVNEFFGSVMQVIDSPTPEDEVLLGQALQWWPRAPNLLLFAAIVDDKIGKRSDARAKLQQILELQPPAPARFQTAATKQLDAWAASEQEAELKALMAARDFSQLRRRVDEIIRARPYTDRARWELFRDQIDLNEKMDRAEQFIRENQRESAIPLLEDILSAPTVDWAIKTKARNMMKEAPAPDLAGKQAP